MRVAIIGLGLIGGSLGKAFRQQRKLDLQVIGIDRSAAIIDLAKKLGIIDDGTVDLATGVGTADIVFFCTPVLSIAPIMLEAAKHAKAGAIFTDVGSTKANVFSQVRHHLPEHLRYVAGHPMAGGEKSGVTAADENLFRQKTYIFMPETTTDAAAISTVKRLIATTGAVLTDMTIAEHDHYAAMISHVPHVAASALVTLLADCQDNPAHRKLIGGGFRDTTRIASSDADMWSDICLANGVEVTEQLQRLQAICGGVIDAIARGDREYLHHFFKAGKDLRDQLITETQQTNR